MTQHIRGVPALTARYDRLFEAYAARTRRHVAALQELAALRTEVTQLRDVVARVRDVVEEVPA